MTLATTILTELAASWAIGVTPKFINWKKDSNATRINSIAVATAPSGEVVVEIGATPAHRTDTIFTLYVQAVTETNRDNFVTEAKRIIRAYSVTSGWWEVTNVDDGDMTNNSTATIDCIQTEIS